jgi:Protein of unknown function with HXXEE motif
MRAELISNLIVPTAIAIIAITIFIFVHPGMRLLFLPAMVAAYVCYLLTSYNRTPKPERILPIYLLALAIQFLHFAEEYVYGFYYRVAGLVDGMPPINTNLFVTFNMIAYCFFILGGLGLYKKVKFSMILVWFFAIAGVIGNAIWHPLFAVKVGGYFPGLYTSFAYWIVGPILLKRLWEVRGYGQGQAPA